MYRYKLADIPANKIHTEGRSIQGKKFYHHKVSFSNEPLDIEKYLNLIVEVQEEQEVEQEKPVLNFAKMKKGEIIQIILTNSISAKSEDELNKLKKSDLIAIIEKGE